MWATRGVEWLPMTPLDILLIISIILFVAGIIFAILGTIVDEIAVGFGLMLTLWVISFLVFVLYAFIWAIVYIGTH